MWKTIKMIKIKVREGQNMRNLFVNDLVIHKSGVKGKVIKICKPKGACRWYIEILTTDNQRYYAPEEEFKKMVEL
jgi:hypothetical protein